MFISNSIFIVAPVVFNLSIHTDFTVAGRSCPLQLHPTIPPPTDRAHVVAESYRDSVLSIVFKFTSNWELNAYLHVTIAHVFPAERDATDDTGKRLFARMAQHVNA